MEEALLDALKDTLAMVPWLFGIHVALEFFAKKTEDFTTEKISHRGSLAPFLGAVFGCIPQCGFSVIAATLYARQCISLGTLLAVFISTSDEAIPVILSQQDKAPLVFWFLLTKVVIGTIAGYTIDSLIKKPPSEKTHLPHEHIIPSAGHQHCSCHTHQGKEAWWKRYLFIPWRHTIRISFFVFLVCLGLNILLEHTGAENLSRFFFSNTLFQPIMTILIGLIPNCAASVIITEVYLKDSISFGSAIAGLCASAGLGTIVLFKENKNTRETFQIIGLLAGISLLAGWILNVIG
ncbi:MAG TPA: putative manganese transporter [Candidatus Omnitrophota bacterium]|nr:putative manganese transporter [Candidatus Omnitrophota bacterium]